LDSLCSLFGYSRQAYYDWRHRKEEEDIEEALIVDLVKHIRKKIPRCGTRTLHFMLRNDWLEYGIKCGRDRLMEILRDHSMLIRPKKKYTTTTNSNHDLEKFPNLVTTWQLEGPEQLWVSDLTYVRVLQTWCYVIFITDVYSHKVVGYQVDDNMKTTMCLQALEMAIESRKGSGPLIHHSDRGVQYCSKAYVKRLKDAGITISMTENGDPLENAVAERVNGIFKDIYNMDRTFNSLEEAKELIAEMVDSYNNQRPHSSCDMMTPAQAHECTGPLKRRWKNYYKSAKSKAGTQSLTQTETVDQTVDQTVDHNVDHNSSETVAEIVEMQPLVSVEIGIGG
jgi:putative transposase